MQTAAEGKTTSSPKLRYPAILFFISKISIIRQPVTAVTTIPIIACKNLIAKLPFIRLIGPANHFPCVISHDESE